MLTIKELYVQKDCFQHKLSFEEMFEEVTVRFSDLRHSFCGNASNVLIILHKLPISSMCTESYFKLTGFWHYYISLNSICIYKECEDVNT